MALTPPSSHTSGGFAGWTDDGSGNVTSAGGSLTFTSGTQFCLLEAEQMYVEDTNDGEQYGAILGTGLVSAGADSTFSIIKGLPVSDPASPGQYYEGVAGVITAST